MEWSFDSPTPKTSPKRLALPKHYTVPAALAQVQNRILQEHVPASARFWTRKPTRFTCFLLLKWRTDSMPGYQSVQFWQITFFTLKAFKTHQKPSPRCSPERRPKLFRFVSFCSTPKNNIIQKIKKASPNSLSDPHFRSPFLCTLSGSPNLPILHTSSEDRPRRSANRSNAPRGASPPAWLHPRHRPGVKAVRVGRVKSGQMRKKTWGKRARQEEVGKF